MVLREITLVRTSVEILGITYNQNNRHHVDTKQGFPTDSNNFTRLKFREPQ